MKNFQSKYLASTKKKVTVMCEEVQNQLNIIATLLGLIDLHENKDNYGIVERQPTKEQEESLATVNGPVQELKIVDFRVDLAQGPSTPKTTMKTCLDFYLDKWRLKENVEKAKHLIMQNEAIRNTSNVNLDMFELYVHQINKILDSFNK